jgi:hypothetical protein
MKQHFEGLEFWLRSPLAKVIEDKHSFQTHKELTVEHRLEGLLGLHKCQTQMQQQRQIQGLQQLVQPREFQQSGLLPLPTKYLKPCQYSSSIGSCQFN